MGLVLRFQGAAMSASDQHNAALLPILRLIVQHAPSEEAQWVLLESLCVGVGRLHGREPRSTALFVENIAERLAMGERG